MRQLHSGAAVESSKAVANDPAEGAAWSRSSHSASLSPSKLGHIALPMAK